MPIMLRPGTGDTSNPQPQGSLGEMFHVDDGKGEQASSIWQRQRGEEAGLGKKLVKIIHI